MPIFVSILLAIIWSLALPVCPQAEVVGHFEKVEGPVDLLKQGQLPVLAPKEKDGVEPGDVIRTKSQGRAQVKFVDESLLTIAPGSRVAIESYMYDASKGARKAVLQVFRGMVQTVVTKIFKTQEPDFTIKTHTAVLGVRGTKTYTLLGPMATDVYNAEGRISVSNIFKEVGGEVILGPLQFSRIMANLTPTAGMNFQKHELIQLDRVLVTGEGISMTPGTGGGPTPFTLMDRFGLPSLQNMMVDPQSSLYRPPQIPAPLPFHPSGGSSGGTGS
jgi:hypothetical protein